MIATAARISASLLLLTVAFDALGASAQDVSDPLRMGACEIPMVAPPVDCGTLRVPEDRGQPEGRQIELRIVRLRTTATPARPDPLFVLAGGPGQAATGMAPFVGQELAAVREVRDLVFVDQRGTGRSNPLECELFGAGDDLQQFLGAFMPVAAVRACRSELEQHTDLTRYTTDIAVDDFDDVRRALGYEQINLYGISYGTRAALTYLRRHGASVRAALLHGALPADEFAPPDFAPQAQRALDGVLAECSADEACRAAFPRIEEDARAVFDRLRAGPVEARIAHPQTGKPVTVRLNRDLAAEAVRYLLYSPSNTAMLPIMLQQAAAGDFSALAEFALFGRQNIVAHGMGLYLSITCTEDLPGPGAAEAARRAEGTFLGDYRFRDQSAACQEWPRAAIAAGFHEPVASDVPVLIVSGEWDPVTPPSYGARVATTLPNALHLVVPAAGHSYEGLEGAACVTALITEFLRAGSAQGLDVGCLAGIRRAGFQLAPMPVEPVHLTRAELEPRVGGYVAPEIGLEMRMELAGGNLRAAFPDGTSVLFVPVAADWFRALGMPGVYLSFEAGEAGRERATLHLPGMPSLSIARQPEPAR
jgi:pimeloyl-ACP methyl ester carboxylesterase